MASYAELADEVRAQIDVSTAVARGWVLDRARVLNAEAAWNLLWSAQIADQSTLLGAVGQYPLPADCVLLEAVFVDSTVYQRATSKQLDNSSPSNTIPAYAQEVDTIGTPLLRLSPIPATGAQISTRYIADLSDDDTSPPFPSDFDSALVDGAIAFGLARMDERFDSAGYFDARFVDSVSRLRRRRHGRYGRGATAIPVIQ